MDYGYLYKFVINNNFTTIPHISYVYTWKGNRIDIAILVKPPCLARFPRHLSLDDDFSGYGLFGLDATIPRALLGPHSVRYLQI